MAWYIAKSLEVLRAQLNARAPARSTASDGGIGDASHSARLSDHNPTETGQVCARDFTNDPAGGMAGQWLADALVASRDPRIKYVIWNRRIIDSRAGQHPWQWMSYSGANDHTHHVHVSVFAGTLGDDTRPWNLGGTADQGEDSVTGDEIKALVYAIWNEPHQNALDPGWTASRDLLRFAHSEAGKARRELNAKLDALLVKAGGASADEVAAKLLPALTSAVATAVAGIDVSELDQLSDAEVEQIAVATVKHAGEILSGGAA